MKGREANSDTNAAVTPNAMLVLWDSKYSMVLVSGFKIFVRVGICVFGSLH